MDAVEAVTHEELKKKGQGDEFLLGETASKSVYRRAHLPGAQLEEMGEIPKLLPDKSA